MKQLIFLCLCLLAISHKLEYLEEEPQLRNLASSNAKWAGFRYSPYGPKKTLEKTPSPSEWMEYIEKFKGHFSGSKGAFLLIVGEESSEVKCSFHFKKPSSGSYSSNIKFSDKDEYEEFLNECDKNDINVWLQVEPGSNDLDELAKIVLNQYVHHKSVKGFGIDLEWWYREDSDKGKKISDGEAKRVVKTVLSYNSDYTVFLKHWKTEFMPPTYRDHLIFIDDSQDFHGDKDDMLDEFGEWAEKFKGSPVFFQVGYAADQNIWEKDPFQTARDVANAASKYNDQVGIFWVDFTLKYVVGK